MIAWYGYCYCVSKIRFWFFFQLVQIRPHDCSPEMHTANRWKIRPAVWSWTVHDYTLLYLMLQVGVRGCQYIINIILVFYAYSIAVNTRIILSQKAFPQYKLRKLQALQINGFFFLSSSYFIAIIIKKKEESLTTSFHCCCRAWLSQYCSNNNRRQQQ